jgi:murein DD-endopeptidase MepM/ murein hydrolase activator NlpD
MALLVPFAAPCSQKFLAETSAEPVGWSRKYDGVHTKAFASHFPLAIRHEHLHLGIDLYAPSGTPILASESGIVSYAGVIANGDHIIRVRIAGRLTYYAHGHCSQLLVKTGAKVTRGQPIALVGHTGNATGPHSHFEVQRAEKGSDGISRRIRYNPARFFPAGTFYMGVPYGGTVVPGGDLINSTWIIPQ